MKDEVVILIAEDDDGHFFLIKKNLERFGINNSIIRFINGQEILDFLFRKGKGPIRELDKGYLLLLDINMPKVDGVEVLKLIKDEPELDNIPVVILTTSDDQAKADECRELGCTAYIVKPVEYEDFVSTIRDIGQYLSEVVIPEIAEVQ
jgi:CheY-like chemotaxis protein